MSPSSLESDAMKKAIADFMQLHNLTSQDMIGQVPVTNVNVTTGSNTSALIEPPLLFVVFSNTPSTYICEEDVASEYVATI